jgi:hypothetical protein
MSATTQSVRDQGVMVVECDIPADLTIAEYKAERRRGASRWEKARVGLLGAGVVGIVAETLLAHRSSR